MDEANTVVVIQYYDEFQVDRFIKCMEKWEAAKTRGYLGYRPP